MRKVLEDCVEYLERKLASFHLCRLLASVHEENCFQKAAQTSFWTEIFGVVQSMIRERTAIWACVDEQRPRAWVTSLFHLLGRTGGMVELQIAGVRNDFFYHCAKIKYIHTLTTVKMKKPKKVTSCLKATESPMLSRFSPFSVVEICQYVCLLFRAYSFIWLLSLCTRGKHTDVHFLLVDHSHLPVKKVNQWSYVCSLLLTLVVVL